MNSRSRPRTPRTTQEQSIDTVTVTVGGKKPTVLDSSTTPARLQSAIDAAAPGDMVIVPPGIYTEMLLMWKPVRLQGVGAAPSVTVNANTHPRGQVAGSVAKEGQLSVWAWPWTAVSSTTRSTAAANPRTPTIRPGRFRAVTTTAVTSGQVTSQTVVDPIPLELSSWVGRQPERQHRGSCCKSPRLWERTRVRRLPFLPKGWENNNKTATCKHDG